MTRRVGPEAAAEIARMVRFVHDWHAATYPEIFKPDPALDPLADHIRHLLEQPGAVGFLSGDPAAGYLIALRRDRPEGLFTHGQQRLLIDQVAVDPTRRREGHGRALFQAAVAHAQANGCGAVFLDSWADNAAAHGFFRAMGFAPRRQLFERSLSA